MAFFRNGDASNDVNTKSTANSGNSPHTIYGNSGMRSKRQRSESSSSSRGVSALDSSEKEPSGDEGEVNISDEDHEATPQIVCSMMTWMRMRVMDTSTSLMSNSNTLFTDDHQLREELISRLNSFDGVDVCRVLNAEKLIRDDGCVDS